MIARGRDWLGAIPRRELLQVGAAAAISTVLVLAYVAATHPNPLTGDQIDYHQQGTFFADGQLWWGITPFGEPHATAWKAPLYTLWVGVIYLFAGPSPTALLAAQSLLAAVTVGLTWGLARRLFSPTAADVSAWIVALFPLVWEWFGLVYTEALAIPLTLLIIASFLERTVTPGRAIGVGVLMGAALLLRPTSAFLFAGIAASWIIALGWRRGIGLTAVTGLVAVLIVAPWTIRNAIVLDGFIPISVQDSAAYGTFNDESANDPEFPYSWRPVTEESTEILASGIKSEPDLRSELSGAATDYVKEHPESLAEAFYWNGLTRLWDVRRPSRAIDEVPFEGRSKPVTIAGLAAYYVLLPLALWGLWRERRRKALALPVLVMAIAASLVFTSASGTRYRAPLEPLIVVLASSAAVGLVRDRNEPAQSPPAAPSTA